MTSRTSPRHWGAAMALVAMLIAGLSGCNFFRERVCLEGQYPVRYKADPSVGRCYNDGETPSLVYETYPPGETPTYVE